MPRFRGPGSSVIAEVKRRSPSKGDLADIPDPAALATAYADGGAARDLACSPSERRFGGSLADLRAVRGRGRRPAAAQGLHRHDLPARRGPRRRRRPRAADRRRARRRHPALACTTRRGELGLTVLVEVHDEAETERALDARCRADRRQRPQPQDPRGRPRHLRAARPADPADGASRSPSPASPARTTCAGYVGRGRRRRPRRRGAGHGRRPARTPYAAIVQPEPSSEAA